MFLNSNLKHKLNISFSFPLNSIIAKEQTTIFWG